MTLFHTVDEEEQMELGERLARCAPEEGGVVFLHGDLGAGKTTLARGFIRGLGHGGRVKSPTYTLLEAYPVAARTCYHLDLYRLSDPGELEYLGLRDLLSPPDLVLVEWPERGEGALPAPDLVIRIGFEDGGRYLELTPMSATGAEWCRCLEAQENHRN